MPNKKILLWLPISILFANLLSGCASTPTIYAQKIDGDPNLPQGKWGVFVASDAPRTNEDYTFLVPGFWLPGSLDQARYEIVVQESYTEIGSCWYTVDLVVGDLGPIERKKIRVDGLVIITDKETNQEIANQQFTGPEYINCPEKISASQDAIYGAFDHDVSRAWVVSNLREQPGITPSNLPYQAGNTFQLSPNGNEFLIIPIVNPQFDGLCVTVRDISTLAMKMFSYCDLDLIQYSGSYAQYSPDGNRILIQYSEDIQDINLYTNVMTTTGQITTIMVDAGTGEHLLTLENVAGVFSPRGSYLIAHTDHSVRLLDPTTGEILQEFGALDRPIHYLDMSGDESKIIAADTDGKVFVWDVSSGDIVNEFELPHKEGERVYVRALDINVDGSKALAVFHNYRDESILNDDEGYLYMWDLSNGRVLWKQDNQEYTLYASFSPDGNWILITPEDLFQRQILDAGRGKLASNLELNIKLGTYNDFYLPVFSPDGSRVYEMKENDLIFWDIPDSDSSQ